MQDVRLISAKHVRAYMVRLGEGTEDEPGERRNEGGAHIAIRSIKTFLKWWQEDDTRDGWTNPFDKIEVSTPKAVPIKPITLGKVKQLVDTCKGHNFKDDRDRAIILCLLDTGCRPSAIGS